MFSNRVRHILLPLLMVGMVVIGCGKGSEAPESSMNVWAETRARHRDGTLDVAILLESKEAVPASVLVFVPLSHEWEVVGAPSAESYDAAASASLARPHLDKGFQLRTAWHDALDMRAGEGCLAIAVYCPTGAATLSSGTLCDFSLSPVHPDAASEPVTLELPPAETPIYLNGTPFAVSAATREAKPIVVSTTPGVLDGNACLLDIRRWFPMLECRRK